MHVAEHEDWDVAKPSDPLVCIARKKMLEKVKSKFKVKAKLKLNLSKTITQKTQTRV